MEKKFTVEGVYKNLEVYENKVVLINKCPKTGLFWLAFIGLTISTLLGGLLLLFVWNLDQGKEKTIYIKNLKSVEIKKPTKLARGFIQFNLDDSRNDDGDLDSENSVTFDEMEKYETCTAIRDFIELKAAA